MSNSLSAMREILDPHFLSGYYEKVSQSTVHNPMLDFFEAKGEDVVGDEIDVPVFSASKEPAPVSPKGNPANELDAIGGEKLTLSPIHAFNEIRLSLHELESLRDPSRPEIQSKGRFELERQFRQFGHRHRMLRAVVLAKSLSDGVVYIDEQGRLLESSTGAVQTIDLQVPASHTAQLAHESNGGTDIIGTAWDDPSANILQDLDKIRTAAESDNAPNPRHVWMHSTAKQWFRDNTELKSYFQASEDASEEAIGGDVVDNLNGYRFHFYDGTYTDASGNMQSLLDPTKAIITPDLGDWFAYFRCDELVPQSDGVFGSMDAMIDQIQRIHGDFAYFKLIDNPPCAALRMGMNFLYAFRDPQAVWQVTVDF